VIGPLWKRYGERVSRFAGIGCGLLGLVGCGLAPGGLWFFLSIVPLCLWSLAPPAGQAMMTRRVEPNEQGQLQGAIGSIRGLATLFGPAIFTTAFAVGVGHALPGAAWFLGALFLAAAVLPILRPAPVGEPDTALPELA